MNYIERVGGWVGGWVGGTYRRMVLVHSRAGRGWWVVESFIILSLANTASSLA